MSDIWYRGEAVGPMVVGGSNPHDFLEEGGLYLTDQEQVARTYARTRAANPAAERVYSVAIDRGTLRVLDLTTDPRWAKFIRPAAPGVPGGEELIRRANENYGRLFRSFIKSEKIDLAQYDAIIGHEYVRGGRQLCILQKGGALSPAAIRIRQAFVQVPVPRTSLASQNRIRPVRSIGPGLRAVGGGAAMLGLALLTMWLRNKINASLIDQQMKAIEPKIMARLSEEKAAIAEIQMNANKAFANVTIAYADMSLPTTDGPVPQYTVVELTSVRVSSSNIEKKPEQTVEFALTTPITKTSCTYSFEVALSSEEIELYRSYKLELQWYEDQIRNGNLAPEDVHRLSADKMKLENQMRQALESR